MKKALLTLLVAGGMALGLAGSSQAESIWYKGWGDRFEYSYHTSYQYTSIKVSFGVWPVAPGHTAGAVYTDDGWATVNWSKAQWEANVSNPYGGQDEAWITYLLGGNTCPTFGCSFTPFTFEFALYVQNAQGQWKWANNGGQNFRVSL